MLNNHKVMRFMEQKTRCAVLKKALYGLKEAPRAWFSKIEAYFLKEKFEKCSSEPTLFVKNGKTAEVLIVSLYKSNCTRLQTHKR